MANDYLVQIRQVAQSILAGVQNLEDLQATVDDNHYSGAEKALNDADNDVWALVDWIREGRPDR